ncbi:helix-turn-helix transcriptional regulator [Actinomadura sp. NPDC049382]|uniref:helix-turn-helix transcriptional regulator n=1 Tax=Actinomadura sp. NPDC049382 TaxID=3158220 RepID=UPI0034466A46
MTPTGPHAWWTGREATALRRAMALTVERFADRVGVSPRTVANWAANPGMAPQMGVQERLDDIARGLPPDVRARFHSLTGKPSPAPLDLSQILAMLTEIQQSITQLAETA